MTRRKSQLLNTAEDLREPRDLGNIAPFEPRRDTVGDLLRRAREGKGLALDGVAQRLRIRPGYLKAIEEGRFQDLPGLTYAVGFVRTYADHLGLDAEDVVRRFRDEVTELKGQPHLVFPVVAAEGKIPRGAVLLLSAVLLAIAYGGWYYLSEREQSALDLIPELPAKLKALVYGEPDDFVPAGTQTADTASTLTVVPPPAAAPAEPASPAPASPPAATGEDQLAEAAPPAAPAVPAPEDVPDATAADAAAAARMSQGASGGGAAVESTATAIVEPAPPVAPAPATELPPPAAPSSALPGVAAPTTPAPAPALDSAGLPTVAAPAPTTGGFAAIAPSEPQGLPPVGDGEVFGATDAPSRIVLVARLESWVEVTDPETNALLTRVLRAGDRYYVPDMAGLTLATGNAGGLDIWVDGRKIPSLGPVGVVRRGIALDPQRLASGTALPE